MSTNKGSSTLHMAVHVIRPLKFKIFLFKSDAWIISSIVSHTWKINCSYQYDNILVQPLQNLFICVYYKKVCLFSHNQSIVYRKTLTSLSSNIYGFSIHYFMIWLQNLQQNQKFPGKHFNGYIRIATQYRCKFVGSYCWRLIF